MKGLGPKLKAKDSGPSGFVPPGDDLDDIFAPDSAGESDAPRKSKTSTDQVANANAKEGAPPSSLRLRRALRRAGVTRLRGDTLLPTLPSPETDVQPAGRQEVVARGADLRPTKRRTDWRVGLLAAVAGILWGSGLAYLAYSYLTSNSHTSSSASSTAEAPTIPLEQNAAKPATAPKTQSKTVAVETPKAIAKPPLPTPVAPPAVTKVEKSTENSATAKSSDQQSAVTQPKEEASVPEVTIEVPPPLPSTSAPQSEKAGDRSSSPEGTSASAETSAEPAPAPATQTDVAPSPVPPPTSQSAAIPQPVEPSASTIKAPPPEASAEAPVLPDNTPIVPTVPYSPTSPSTQPSDTETQNAQQTAEVAPKVAETAANVKTVRDCGDCPLLVIVPAGEFSMGSTASDPNHQDDESPRHSVNFTKPFALGSYEVTFDQWDECVKDGACKDAPADEGWGRGSNPVVNISWDDITKQFLPWLTKKSGKSYRLPTESEWEYAARSVKGTGNELAFGFGNNASELCTFGNGADLTAKESSGSNEAIDCRDGFANTAPVGSFKPNGFGLYDMHGNVWEWVADCWNDNYAGAPVDGAANLGGDCSTRVLRGGSWNSDTANLRSAVRGWNREGGHSDSIGFRVARDL